MHREKPPFGVGSSGVGAVYIHTDELDEYWLVFDFEI